MRAAGVLAKGRMRPAGRMFEMPGLRVNIVLCAVLMEHVTGFTSFPDTAKATGRV